MYSIILRFPWSQRSKCELTYHMWYQPRSQWGELRTEQLFSGWSHECSGFISIMVCGDRGMWPTVLVAGEMQKQSFMLLFTVLCFCSFFSSYHLIASVFWRYKLDSSRICRSTSFVMTEKKDKQILMCMMQCPGNLNFLLMLFLQPWQWKCYDPKLSMESYIKINGLLHSSHSSNRKSVQGVRVGFTTKI